MTGLAIQTTAQLLMEAISDDPQVKIGHVQYIDFRHGFAGIHDRIHWKRKSLSHEAEVRAVMVRHDRQDDLGLTMPADLQHAIILIELCASPRSIRKRWL
jgi:hypothetical protein